jgi:hypothetical protein
MEQDDNNNEEQDINTKNKELHDLLERVCIGFLNILQPAVRTKDISKITVAMEKYTKILNREKIIPSQYFAIKKYYDMLTLANESQEIITEDMTHNTPESQVSNKGSLAKQSQRLDEEEVGNNNDDNNRAADQDGHTEILPSADSEISVDMSSQVNSQNNNAENQVSERSALTSPPHSPKDAQVDSNNAFRQVETMTMTTTTTTTTTTTNSKASFENTARQVNTMTMTTQQPQQEILPSTEISVDVSSQANSQNYDDSIIGLDHIDF